ncbi:MAG: hypothetical protein AAGJ69_09500 [Cyanobacteria bacterium J06559_1]
MRKVTASAVILTALTGCSHSKAPSSQWSFEVPTNTTANTQQSTSTANGLPQRPSPDSLASLSAKQTGFIGNPASGKMGPAFEQPTVSSALNDSDISGMAAENAVKVSAEGNGGNAVSSLLSSRSTTQSQSYMAPSLRSPLLNYRAPFSRVPFSANNYLPASPNYTSAPASYEALAPVPFTSYQPDAAPASPVASPLVASAPSSNSPLPQALAQNSTPELSAPLSASPSVSSAPVELTPTVPMAMATVEESAISQPAASPLATSNAVAPAPVSLDALLQTLPHRNESSTELTNEVNTDEIATDEIATDEIATEPAILSIIRADQQARRATAAPVAERMPALAAPDLAIAEPLTEANSTPSVSPLLEELQPAADSTPLQAVYVPIPETSTMEVPAAFILEAIAALSEEANTAPLSVPSSAQLVPTPAQASLPNRTTNELNNEPTLSALPQLTPETTSRLELASTEAAIPSAQAALNTQELTPNALLSPDTTVNPAKVMEAYRKGVRSAVGDHRYQSRRYRQRIVWQ